jgi:hypothetical protein
MSDILKLVNELAVFEKEPDAVVINLDDYIANFEKGVFDALVVENETDGIIGICFSNRFQSCM